ncbi:MAG: DUF4874 domain-containing protein [Oscillospiraceae bacterium]|nr:DUF4874 domain-containing protein [Oscillospiraceae bacterium]
MISTATQATLATAFTLPVHSLATARPMLQNPDRGLRMEHYITLGQPLQSYPGNSECPFEKMLFFIEKYREESPTVVQLYVYLTKYNEKPLDELAFAQLEQMLQLLRDNNVRALLRFTYQNEAHPDAAWPQVREHLQQIGQWINENHQLVQDSIFCVQGGIVGLWGEAHNNQNFHSCHIGDAFNLLLDIVPDNLFVQVRNIDLLPKILPHHTARVGMHDDYMIGETHGRWNFFLGRDDEECRTAQTSFWRSINDGEMPWGQATYYDEPGAHDLDSMNVMPILQQFLQYSLTTFSLEHNYREDIPGRRFSMHRWRDQTLSEEQLREAGLPYHPALLDDDGNINTFEYIRHHLGYLLTVTEFALDDETLRFTIQNNGFAAPLNFHALSLVLDGEDFPVACYDRFALGSMQAATYTVQLPQLTTAQHIGLRLARQADSPIAARFMNDTAFINGVQIITKVKE